MQSSSIKQRGSSYKQLEIYDELKEEAVYFLLCFLILFPCHGK